MNNFKEEKEKIYFNLKLQLNKNNNNNQVINMKDSQINKLLT